MFIAFVAAFCIASLCHAQPAQKRSSFADMGTSTQALQRDDTQNPAMLWVQDGQRLMQTPSVVNGKSCAQCHNAGASRAPSLQAAATRYPALDALTQQPFTLAQRVNACRSRLQALPALPSEHQDLLAITAALGHSARGQPITAPAAESHKALQAAHDLGQKWFFTRIGQLNLSCAQCHDERAGLSLGGTKIPQGHPTGYPIYRLEWQGMGSLARRIRGCMTGVRAEPFAHFSPEMTALEVYLAARATGMPLETPAVRP